MKKCDPTYITRDITKHITRHIDSVITNNLLSYVSFISEDLLVIIWQRVNLPVWQGISDDPQ